MSRRWREGKPAQKSANRKVTNYTIGIINGWKVFIGRVACTPIAIKFGTLFLQYFFQGIPNTKYDCPRSHVTVTIADHYCLPQSIQGRAGLRKDNFMRNNSSGNYDLFLFSEQCSCPGSAAQHSSVDILHISKNNTVKTITVSCQELYLQTTLLFCCLQFRCTEECRKYVETA